MSVDRSVELKLIAEKAAREALAQRLDAQSLHPVSGGGNDGSMERRLSLVEDAVNALRKDTGDLKVNMATLTERVSHLPGKGFIVTALATSLALIAAMLAFAEKIQALVS